MKKLYLIRHAKSSWKNLTLADYDRPLNKRGKLNAPFMGNLLYQLGIKPDIIVSSPAYRARKTAQLIAKEVRYNKKDIDYYEDLYEASINNIIDTLKYLDDKNSVVFLVGHNPSLNLFAEQFLDFDENIPTCAILEIEFNCQLWQEISSYNSKLITFEYPKKYL
ncbi:SixA phosphatase family protein [Malaciobacter canalis]|uniref:SixA phosphatase family protein n=1 Tax=Malaciobacter canalis TaxID=1912871 RepID=UPI0038516BAB